MGDGPSDPLGCGFDIFIGFEASVEDAEGVFVALEVFFGEGVEPGTRAMLPRYLLDLCRRSH